MTPRGGEPALTDYVRIVARRWRWAAVPVVLLPLLVLAISLARPDRYEATARVLVARSAAEAVVQGSTTNAQNLSRSINNEINLARSDRVEAEVRARLGLAADEPLPDTRISAEADTDVLSFDVLSPDAEEGAEAANAWADAYVAVRRADAARVIDETIADLQADLDDLQAERSAVRSDLEGLEDALARADEEDQAVAQLAVDREASRISGELALLDTQIEATVGNLSDLSLSRDLAGRGSAEVFERAEPPQSPANASPWFNTGLALVPSAAIGVALALARHDVDQRISDARDVEARGYPVLSVVPRPSGNPTENELARVGATDPASAVADAYQRARTSIQFAGRDVRSIVVTSPNQGDGKTTTSVNLAIAFAATGQAVVLVDADLRRPRVHEVFETRRVPGLTDIVSANVAIGGVAATLAGGPATLFAIPAGAQWPSPASFLSGESFRRQAAALSKVVDLVIYDAPPVLAVSDALSVAQETDGTVLVARAGQTTRDELDDAADAVRDAGGRLLGVVLIGVDDGSRYGHYDVAETSD